MGKEVQYTIEERMTEISDMIKMVGEGVPNNTEDDLSEYYRYCHDRLARRIQCMFSAMRDEDG